MAHQAVSQGKHSAVGTCTGQCVQGLPANGLHPRPVHKPATQGAVCRSAVPSRQQGLLHVCCLQHLLALLGMVPAKGALGWRLPLQPPC